MGCKGSTEKEEPKQETQEKHDPMVVDGLPAGAEKFHCHHVYDGDTLTLSDHRRIRVLYIDTPEVKEKQPFAIEARDELARLCARKDFYCAYQDGEKEDRYGRLLGLLYTEHPTVPGKFLFINLHMVQLGLAGYYHPGQEAVPCREAFLAVQKEARDHGVGKWGEAADQMREEVVCTRNGKAYHKRSCQHVAHVRHLTAMTVAEAMDSGHSGCRDCFA
jgi:endonuclease YncB( thermonuclease family)